MTTKKVFLLPKKKTFKSLFPGNVDYVSNSIGPNDDFIFLSAARKLPLDTLLLPNNHRYDCTSVSLISRPEAIVALDTSLHQLPVIGPVMILSSFAPNMWPRKLPLDTLLHYKLFLTPKFRFLTLPHTKTTTLRFTNASSHQNFQPVLVLQNNVSFYKRFLTPKFPTHFSSVTNDRQLLFS